MFLCKTSKIHICSLPTPTELLNLVIYEDQSTDISSSLFFSVIFIHPLEYEW